MIHTLIKAGALFFVNHSGGKDSQAMYLRLKKIVPASQLVVIHASLGSIEWAGTIDHITATVAGPVIVCSAKKTFFEMVQRRGMFPDLHRRQCTSDLKRDPIELQIRKIMKARGATVAVNCIGLRAQESSNRAKAATFKQNNRLTIPGRLVYDWLPIHKMQVQDVFETIQDAGQVPHWAYAAGMTRLSCSFCIMSSQGDLKTAARLRPDLLAQYIDLEKTLGHTLQISKKPLTELVK